jgi:hypothetical protein
LYKKVNINIFKDKGIMMHKLTAHDLTQNEAGHGLAQMLRFYASQ